jgi:hypothetical protein
LQHGASTHDEQSSQIRVAALGDVPEPRLAAARVLARDESEPGGELAAVLEVMAIANGGNQGRCSDGSDAKARLHTAGERIGAHVYFDLLFVLERLGLQSYGVLQ